MHPVDVRVLHVISGGDVGGAKTHVLLLLGGLRQRIGVKLVCLTAGPFFQEAREAGLDVVLLEQRTRYDLLVLRDLLGLVRSGGFQIVHSHGPRANFLVSLVKPLWKRPLVTTVHSDYLLDFAGNAYKSLLYGNLNRLALRCFDYYVAVSDSFRRMLLDRGFPPDRVFTIYNGIDFSDAPPPAPRQEVLRELGLPIPPSGVLVGIVGRLAPVKGHAVLLRAASVVAREHPDVHFLILGDGDEKPRLQALARELGISDRVHFLGHHPHPERIVATFDINVLASFSESFPYALLEGARLALATVSSDVGSVSELVIDGQTGRLFPPGDTGALARCLGDLVSDPARRHELGQRLYEHARARFSVENMTDQQVAIYHTILRREAKDEQ
ncbi:MAG: glycosyltransferase [Bacillota bacterium]|nr:glycosyltransferase [Bacillota bacterium]MDI7249902.1 glycosyltransferase [Bacillota bacterium]